MSAVTTMSRAPARAAIQSSAESSCPPATSTSFTAPPSGTRIREFATRTTGIA